MTSLLHKFQNNSKEISEYTNRRSKQSTKGSNNNSHQINNTIENGQASVTTTNAAAKKSTNDANRRKSIQTKTIDDATDQGNDNENGVIDTDGTVNGNTATTKHAKLNRQSSAETSIDDVNNKLTSHAFQSYDEQEHLESKEIQSPTTDEMKLNLNVEDVPN